VSMASATAPYLAWLSAAAALAEQTAAQLTVARARLKPRRATVPPPVIAANRALFADAHRDQRVGRHTPGSRP